MATDDTASILGATFSPAIQPEITPEKLQQYLGMLRGIPEYQQQSESIKHLGALMEAQKAGGLNLSAPLAALANYVRGGKLENPSQEQIYPVQQIIGNQAALEGEQTKQLNEIEQAVNLFRGKEKAPQMQSQQAILEKQNESYKSQTEELNKMLNHAQQAKSLIYGNPESVKEAAFSLKKAFGDTGSGTNNPQNMAYFQGEQGPLASLQRKIVALGGNVRPEDRLSVDSGIDTAINTIKDSMKQLANQTEQQSIRLGLPHGAFINGLNLNSRFKPSPETQKKYDDFVTQEASKNPHLLSDDVLNKMSPEARKKFIGH